MGRTAGCVFKIISSLTISAAENLGAFFLFSSFVGAHMSTNLRIISYLFDESILTSPRVLKVSVKSEPVLAIVSSKDVMHSFSCAVSLRNAVSSSTRCFLIPEYPSHIPAFGAEVSKNPSF